MLAVVAVRAGVRTLVHPPGRNSSGSYKSRVAFERSRIEGSQRPWRECMARKLGRLHKLVNLRVQLLRGAILRAFVCSTGYGGRRSVEQVRCPRYRAKPQLGPIPGGRIFGRLPTAKWEREGQP